jgi:hypothetical protein
VVYTPDRDVRISEFLDTRLDAEEANKRADAVVSKHLRGDVSRLAYFHKKSFPGVRSDIDRVTRLLRRLQTYWNSTDRNAEKLDPFIEPFPHGNPRRGTSSDDEESAVEKAIYRLKLLGLVTDYRKNYQETKFELDTYPLSQSDVESNFRRYMCRYGPEQRAEEELTKALALRSHPDSPERYDHVVRQLCQFIYDEIEKERRVAIRNVVDAVEKANGDGDALGDAIYLHLEKNAFSSELARIARELKPDDWLVGIFSEVKTAYHAVQLAAACRRTRESAADHPGLLTIQGLVSLRLDRPDLREVAIAFAAAFKNLSGLYGRTREQVQDFATKLLSRCADLHSETFSDLVRELLRQSDYDLIARAAYQKVKVTDRELRQACAVPWISEITNTARAIRERHLGVTREDTDD